MKMTSATTVLRTRFVNTNWGMGPTIDGVVFDQADLTGSDLGWYGLFTDSDFSTAVVLDLFAPPGTSLRGSSFNGADLGASVLQNIDLQDTDFRGADLTEADLLGSWMNGADLTGQDGAALINTGASLSGTNISGADFTGVDLHGAGITNAVATGVDLTNADLTGASFTGTDLTSAIVTGAIWSGTGCPDGTNSDVDDGDGFTCLNNLTGASVPAAPANVVAVAGDASVQVSWTAPDDGGSPITGYTVTASFGIHEETVDGATTTALITGLLNGNTYTFTVIATNAFGESPPSTPSNPATPQPD